MLSREGLNLADLETIGVSRNPTTVITASGEVQTHEDATVTRPRRGALRDGTNPWGHACSLVGRTPLRRTRIFIWVGQCQETTLNQQWQNLVQHGKTMYRSLSQDCQQVPPALPQGTSDDSSSSPATIRSGCTSIPASGNWLRDLLEWLDEFTENLERRTSVSIKWHTRKHFSWIRFGTSNKSGIEEAQYLYSFPERPKSAREPRLQGLLAGNALVMPHLVQKTLTTWSEEITKFSVKKVNLERICDTESCYMI